MSRRVQKLPIHPRSLKRVRSALLEGDPRVLEDTLDWFTRHRTEEAVKRAIQVGWEGTSLALRQWAADIESCEIWVTDNIVRLAVHLSGGRQTPVLQAVPFTPARFDELVSAFPSGVPDILRELALAAPGVGFVRSGALAHPSYLLQRLKHTALWFRSQDRPRIEQLNYEFLDPDRHQFEVAENGIGDLYIADAEGAIYFFNHEVPGLLRCSIDIRTLFEAYLADSDKILDPYVQGWAVEPPEKPSDTSETVEEHPFTILSIKKRSLPFLARLALAVRGCERALDTGRKIVLPVPVRRHEQALRDIVSRCRMTATTGEPLRDREAGRMQRIAKAAIKPLQRAMLAIDPDFTYDLLTVFSLPALVRGCAAPDQAKPTAEAAGWCSTIMTRLKYHKERQTLAAINDVDHLIGLGLGSPDEMGQPVPPDFFERPLWPDEVGQEAM